MPPFVPGMKDTFDSTDAAVLLDLADGLEFLNPRQDGIAVMKKIGLKGFSYRNHKHEWQETQLATRREAITIDGSATALTVADAYQYQLNSLLSCENEVMRVTAHASATVLTVIRGVAGTSAAVHTAALMQSLGTAMPEGADGSAGLGNSGAWLYNYDQIFERGVDLSKHEIAGLHSEGNPLPFSIRMRFIEIMREVWQAGLYGRRWRDASSKIYATGGFTQFVTTNVDNVGGDATVAAIDAIIKAIVDAGGDPKAIGVGTYQKQKLDALDANLIRTGKRDRDASTGGNPNVMTWQSGILDHDLDIIVDHTILDDQLHVYDYDLMECGHLNGNGVSGLPAVLDTTPNGANRKSQVIRAMLMWKFKQEKGLGYLYGLT